MCRLLDLGSMEKQLQSFDFTLHVLGLLSVNDVSLFHTAMISALLAQFAGVDTLSFPSDKVFLFAVVE